MGMFQEADASFVAVFDRAHPGRMCGFLLLWLKIAIEPSSLFKSSVVLIFV